MKRIFGLVLILFISLVIAYTPMPSSVCTPGEITSDDIYFFRCNNESKWGRVLLSAFEYDWPVCGNGLVEGNETCDNQTLSCNIDGYEGSQYCLDDCSGYGICNTTFFCGDFILNGNETCDSGEISCTNGIYSGSQLCLPDCSGYGSCEVTEYCGDFILNGNESCDSDYFTCTIAGYEGAQYCLDDCSGYEDCTSDEYCGDNIINGPEECDSDLGQVCTPDYASSCIYCGLDCMNVDISGGYCGDDIVNGPEECDSDLGQVCTPEYNSSCVYCDACTNVNLTGNYCGDNIINGPEECDLNLGQVCTPDYNSSCVYCDACTNVSLTGSYCGDNIINGPEECESDLGECTPEYNSTCVYCDACANVTLTGSYCGDTVCDAEEDCSTCQEDCGVCPPLESCGDGIVNGLELCDDGVNNGVACTPDYNSTCTYCDVGCVPSIVYSCYIPVAEEISTEKTYCSGTYSITGNITLLDGAKLTMNNVNLTLQDGRIYANDNEKTELHLNNTLIQGWNSTYNEIYIRRDGNFTMVDSEIRDMNRVLTYGQTSGEILSFNDSSIHHMLSDVFDPQLFDNIRINRMTFYNATGDDCLSLKQNADGIVNNTEIYNCADDGVYLYSHALRNTFENIYSHDTGGHCFAFDDTNFTTAKNLTAKNCGGYAIDFFGYGNNHEVTDSQVNNAAHGIMFSMGDGGVNQSFNLTSRRNIIGNVSGYGVYWTSANTGGSHSDFIDNATERGIGMVTDVYNINVTDAYIINVPQYSVYLHNGVYDLDFSNITIVNENVSWYINDAHRILIKNITMLDTNDTITFGGTVSTHINLSSYHNWFMNFTAVKDLQVNITSTNITFFNSHVTDEVLVTFVKLGTSNDVYNQTNHEMIAWNQTKYTVIIGPRDVIVVGDFGNEPSIPGSFCGDGIINGLEECDLDLGQVCTPDYNSSCVYCDNNCTNVTLTGSYCGDAVCDAEEDCSSCEIDCGACPLEYCGDGIINGQEECDSDLGLVCSPDYNSSCIYCDNNCTNVTLAGSYCGDDIINGPEECDSNVGQVCTPAYNSSCVYCDACLNVTVTDSYCGDAVCNVEEDCSSCETDCGACPVEYCGDGIINGQEECDSNLGLVCSPDYNSSCIYCDNCTNVTLTGSYCGDTVCDAEEDCNCADCGVCPPTEYCGDGICNGNETASCDDCKKNLRLAAAILSGTDFSNANVQWLDNNLDFVVLHEPLMDDVADINTTIMLYKSSAWNAEASYLSVCCYDNLSVNEDWFLHCGDGRCRDPNTDYESYWMDYRNTEWQEHSLEDINADLSNNAVDGVFYDAIQIVRGELDNPVEYKSDAEVRNALFGLMSYLNENLTKSFMVNAAPYNTGFEDYPGGALVLGKKLMDLSDGFWDESFAINWGGGWYNDEIINAQLELMDYAEQTNTTAAFSSLFRKTISDNFDDIIALYLLGQNDYTYFGFNYRGYNYYNYYRWINSYQYLLDNAEALGRPLNDRYLNGTIYYRDYTNGYVYFDMAVKQGEIILA